LEQSMSREEAAAKEIYSTSGRNRVMPYSQAKNDCEAESRQILAAADAHDAANGVHRVSLEGVPLQKAALELMRRITEVDFTPPEALDHVRAIIRAAAKEAS
jgi:hypothetical protein